MTYDDVRRMFVYEPETGMLRRIGGLKDYPWHETGGAEGRRYLATTVGRKTYYLHQLVWLYHHGVIPKEVDHIDLDRFNCRIENLRPCTHAQNKYNALPHADNKSGYKGVVFCLGYRSPWRARIYRQGKAIPLGYYDTPEEAAAAYAMGAEQYAGEFARA